MSVDRPKVVIIGAGFGGLAAAQRLSGAAVDVTIVDRQSQKPTPTRVELTDAQGKAHVADDALPVDDSDCRDRDLPFDVSLERAVGVMRRSITSPYSGATQFPATTR